jgi:hypothetical protein
MYTRGGNLTEISERLVDAILADNVLSKEKLIPKIRAIIKAWIAINDRPIDWDKTPITEMGKMKRNMQRDNMQKEFFKNKLKDLKTDEEMKIIYEESNKQLIYAGLE